LDFLVAFGKAELDWSWNKEGRQERQRSLAAELTLR
jgi:hypothetical protein